MVHTANHCKLPEKPSTWGEARGRASFIVIVCLVSPPCLIGMDIMLPLRVHIDVTNGTATPAQPDPQTVHLNAAQSQQQHQKEPHWPTSSSTTAGGNSVAGSLTLARMNR